MENFRAFVEDPKFQRRGPLKVTAMFHTTVNQLNLVLDDGEVIHAKVTWLEDFPETNLRKIHAKRPNPGNEAMMDLIEVYHYTDLGTSDVAYIRPGPKS